MRKHRAVNTKPIPEKIAKLRRPERVAEMEVERVVGLTLADSPACRLLDIGTGSGLFAEAFQKAGARVVAVDPDPEMLIAARGFVPELAAAAASAEALPFSSARFDRAFMGMVLHETRDPIQSLAEMRRVARSTAVVLEWPPPDPGQPSPPARRFSPEELRELAAAAGFNRCDVLPLKHMILYSLKP
jgi:ubiquinone/menaquinone biosynthesis C-methylase UbiE